ncbi:LamG-like jellyroll fold domain-containing protein [Comamonas terrae]|uniref:LamG-like jellyroll fold domain-containing protein n=1 Tax=Comamonas terrae TaxID=673548 RepID=A0ABW5URF7_9BURK|nr:LamG-like jellyroll fold domain-containing protein [Comamonas terrae]
MPVYRLCGIDARDGDLDLNDLQLWAQGVRVDAGAVLTCSLAPMAGSVGNLVDGDPATGCRWAAADVRAPGFWIQIDVASSNVDQWYFGGQLVPARIAVQMPGGGTYNIWPEIVSGGAWFRNTLLLQSILDATPVGAWALDDPSTTQPDLVGTRNGTRAGGVIKSQRITEGTNGAFDPAATGLISIPAGTMDAGAFSVVFDIATSTGANLVIAEHGNDNRGWSIQTAGPENSTVGAVPGQLLCLANYGSFGGLTVTNTIVGDGQTHRVVFTVGATGVRRVYIDGIPDLGRDTGGTGRPAYNTTSVHVGSRNGNYGLPAGSLLSAFAVFSRELTAAEAIAVSGDPRVTRKRAMQSDTSLRLLSETSPLPQGLQNMARHRTAKLLDAECGGQGRIYGTVARKNTPTNVPLSRRVRLHRSVDGYLARETWSKADGSYEFRDISTRYEWDVIAWDHELQEYSAIANNQRAEVIA